MTQDTTLFILPRSKEGEPDHRFASSAERILNEVGAGTIEDLLQFAKETESIQRRAASAGLKLALAIFSEAKYLDKHHRFDKDNQHGWRSKLLRKQAQRILENVGFKQKNAHKLVACASWLSSQHLDKDEVAWMELLTPSHIYELSRMNREGYMLAKKEVSYPDFHFSAGQQVVSVRRLEELRRLHPNTEIEVSSETQKLKLLDPVPDSNETPTAAPNIEPEQDGIKMLIKSLKLIGSIDQLSASQIYIEQLRPHFMTLEMLAAVASPNAEERLRR